jgi:hypothetical protein
MTARDPGRPEAGGQPRCRNRLAYLMHDIAIRAAERRDALAAVTTKGDAVP